MKTKTTTHVMCSLTDKEIVGKPALVLQGRILKFVPEPDATEEVVLESGDGDAYLLDAFLQTVKDRISPPRPRKPHTHVEAVTEHVLLKTIKAAGGTIALAKLNTCGTSPHAVKKGLDAALTAGSIVRHAKGVYGLPVPKNAATAAVK